MKIRIVVAAAAALAALVWSVPTGAQVQANLEPPAQACDDPTQHISLYARNMKGGKVGFGRTRGTVKVPGPTLQMNEGDCLSITLVNESDKRISFHAHGVEYTVRSDGTPLNNSCVAPGKARTYVVDAPLPITRPDGTLSPGSAGYWHYHDHCRGTVHGTEGVRKGAFGALIVRRAGDPRPDRPPFVVVMTDNRINLKRAPRTPIFRADQGERVEFVVIGHGDDFHTFHLHAHRWADTRTGLIRNVAEAQSARLVDNVTVGPADSFGFQVVAGEGVGPGAWMYHCHVQFHSDLGMEGLFVVRTPEGEMNQQIRKAVRRWKNTRHRGH